MLDTNRQILEQSVLTNTKLDESLANDVIQLKRECLRDQSELSNCRYKVVSQNIGSLAVFEGDLTTLTNTPIFMVGYDICGNPCSVADVSTSTYNAATDQTIINFDTYVSLTGYTCEPSEWECGQVHLKDCLLAHMNEGV